MKAQFWHERWEENQLGFHQTEVNPMLKKYWPSLGLADGAPVFVPLCGKSLDMIWLKEQGHPVIGVELSPIACRDFFQEAELDFECKTHGELETYQGEGFTIHCGDFFALSARDLEGVAGAFDRGSLVALPPEMRARYAKHMAEILPASTRVLLSTVVYDQSEMKGPPHSVPDEEVERLFGEAFDATRLAQNGPGEPPPPFKARGLRSFSESIWQLERKASA